MIFSGGLYIMKIKKIFAAILACTFICKASFVTEVAYRSDSFITASAATEESGTLGANITWELDDNGTLTISGSGDIPSDLSQLYNEEIKSIVINNGITTIGDMAFANFKNLTSVILSDSITNIGYAAFYSCKNLTSITIPDSVISIGFDVFYDTPWLEEQRKNNPLVIVNGILIDGYSCEGDVIIPNDVTSINVSAFSDCENLTSIIIHDNVTSIGDVAFANCKNLKSITISDSITSIGEYAFYGTPWLEEQRKINPLVIINGKLIDGYSCEGDVIIPNSVTSIGIEAFSNCKSLTSITIPDSVTSIGDYAFSGCENLTSVIIPDSITSIGYSVFSRCIDLTSITIPDSITSIGLYAFYDCENLASIILPDSVTSIRAMAFSGCQNLASITIPASVTVIDAMAFSGCQNLASITIPASVTSIEYKAFYNCSSLKSITIENPKCTISVSSDTISNTATIYGYKDSTAQNYAEKYERNFILIDDAPSTTTSTVTTTTPNTTDNLPGDANCDNKVDIADVIIIKCYLINNKQYSMSQQGLINADVNGKGNGVNIQDSLAILKFTLSITDSL